MVRSTTLATRFDIDIENAQIYYIGHSMGTTTYMAMNSMDPTWADKVRLSKMYTTNINIGLYIHLTLWIISLLFSLDSHMLEHVPTSLGVLFAFEQNRISLKKGNF